MAATYTTNKRFLKQGTGDNNNTWGTFLGSGVHDLIDESFTGQTTVTDTSSTRVLTVNDGTTDEQRKPVVNCTGVLVGDLEVTVTLAGYWMVKNNTSGNYALKFGTSGGTQVTVLQGTNVLVYCDGTDTEIISTNLGGFTGATVSGLRSTAPAGYLALNGDTMGSQASGATQAHNENENLFVLIWDQFADAEAAVSGGRGASAAADWASNKTITLPDATGRTVAGKEVSATRLTDAAGGVDGGTLGASGGIQETTIDLAHTHTGPSHTHAWTGTVQNNTNTFGRDTTSGPDQFADPSHAHDVNGTNSASGTGSTSSSLGDTSIALVQPTIVLGIFVQK